MVAKLKTKAVRSRKSFELRWIFAKFDRLLQKKTKILVSFDSQNRNQKLTCFGKSPKKSLKIQTILEIFEYFWTYFQQIPSIFEIFEYFLNIFFDIFGYFWNFQDIPKIPKIPVFLSNLIFGKHFW